jgi:ribosomal protein S18 acetylase RimI-like enzyme
MEKNLPSEKLIFRNAPVPDDIKAVSEIVRSTGFFREDEILVAVELVQERLEKGLSSGYLFLFAEIDGIAVAYSCYGLIPCTLHSYDLYWIACHHDYRGKGIGSRLLAMSEEKIKKKGGYGVYIETSSKDQYIPSVRFYEKSGYLLKARLPHYYAKDDDKLVFVKYLEQT